LDFKRRQAANRIHANILHKYQRTAPDHAQLSIELSAVAILVQRPAKAVSPQQVMALRGDFKKHHMASPTKMGINPCQILGGNGDAHAVSPARANPEPITPGAFAYKTIS
jgi:hypothetical protein